MPNHKRTYNDMVRKPPKHYQRRQDVVDDRLNPSQRYRKGEKLGEGTYGSVYRCKDLMTNKWVAVKRMKNQDDGENGVHSNTVREVATLKFINHPNVVKLLDVYEDNENTCLVFESLQTDLSKHLKQSVQRFSLSYVRTIMRQLLGAVAHLHSVGIAHRDIKPANVFIDNSHYFVVKLGDLGLACDLRDIQRRALTREVVTLWYRAPEVLLGERHYDCSIDVWSLGCLFAELITGQALLPGSSEIDQLFLIFNLIGTPTDATWKGFSLLPDYNPEFPNMRGTLMKGHKHWPKSAEGGIALDLLSRMLVGEPRGRITAAEALKHPFFHFTTSPVT